MTKLSLFECQTLGRALQARMLQIEEQAEKYDWSAAELAATKADVLLLATKLGVERWLREDV